MAWMDAYRVELIVYAPPVFYDYSDDSPQDICFEAMVTFLESFTLKVPAPQL